MNIAARSGILIWEAVRTEDGIYAKTGVRQYKKLRTAAKKTSTVMRVKKRHGFPFLINRYKKRIGLPAGFAIFCAVIYFSSLFVWTVDIKNTTSLSDEKLKTAVYSCGVHPGVRLKNINADVAEIDIENALPQLSWVSVNTGKNRIEVLVKEKTEKPKITSNSDICNLLALKDGLITEVCVYSGSACVKAGDTVAAGDLLASGISDTEQGGNFAVHCSGCIKAQTENTITESVPLIYTEKVKTGECKTQYSFLFFNKIFKLYFGGEPEFLNISKTQINYLNLFNTTLPFGVQKKTFYAVKQEQKVFLTDEAAQIAKQRAHLRANIVFCNAEILNTSEGITLSDNTLTYTLKLACIENIAYEQSVSYF